jgi:lysosomal acid lipase/cholesteryl ester hydrolase
MKLCNTSKYTLGYFRQYDYGDVDKNLRMYNSTIPPDYQLEKITAPIALFSSDNDWLATTKVESYQAILFP